MRGSGRRGATTPVELLVQISAYIALTFGLFFFIFAAKYYLSVLLVLLGRSTPEKNFFSNNLRSAGKVSAHFNNPLNKSPKPKGDPTPRVSIHLPFYNEKNVAERILNACTNLDYPNYEVVVVDDSRDETIEILKKWSEKRGSPTVKFVHRKDRQGFKGGALSEALRHTDPLAEYIMVFDADFVPPPDIIQQFLLYFEMGSYKNVKNLVNKNSKNNDKSNEHTVIEEVRAWYERRRIAAVQGYQLHYLNKNENWITRGVRAEFGGSYMIERVAEEFFGAMKMIAGSVFMIRSDVLRKHGWSTSLTEDWELTIRLYLDGYKVVYTPLIQAAAEIPTTIRRLARQRMRWAEGHTFAVKKYFWKVLESPMLTLTEKLEFLYFAPYYLQSFFFLTGSTFWLLSEMLSQNLHYHAIPQNLAFLGWSLVLTNMISLPLMGLAGLFMEKSARRDFSGIFSFIVLTYVLAPFQAGAALKGLLEKKEGTWFRTPKTGKITELIFRIQLRKVLSWILPARKGSRAGGKEDVKKRRSGMVLILLIVMSSMIGGTASMSSALSTIPQGSDPTALTFRYSDSPLNVCNLITNRYLTHPNWTNLGNTTHKDSWKAGPQPNWTQVWNFYLHGPLEQPYTMSGKIAYYMYLYIEPYQAGGDYASFRFYIYDINGNGVSTQVHLDTFNVLLDESSKLFILNGTDITTPYTFQAGHTIRIRIDIYGTPSLTYHFEYNSQNRPSRAVFPGIVVPENALFLTFLMPAIPIVV
ncbi:MAG: glycosyltransferase, partial [Candidatus Bathyarchaeia archaeon]